MATTITWHGGEGWETYSGYDPELDTFVTLAAGQSEEVSDSKAAQMLEDFPHLCAKGSAKPKSAAKAKAEPEPPVEPEE